MVSSGSYSTINVNAGDFKLIKKYEEKLKKSKMLVLHELLGAFFIGLCSSIVASYLVLIGF